MKQYRLLKDLPGIKAGAISKHVYTNCYAFEGETADYIIEEGTDFEEVHIKEGWIEEVEEKEFTRKDVETMMYHYANYYYERSSEKLSPVTVSFFFDNMKEELLP